MFTGLLVVLRLLVLDPKPSTQTGAFLGNFRV